MKKQFEFRPRDLWVGVYWKSQTLNYSSNSGRDGDGVYRGNDWSERWDTRYDVWVCLLPCLPLHLTWVSRGRGRHFRKGVGILPGPHPQHSNLPRGKNNEG